MNRGAAGIARRFVCVLLLLGAFLHPLLASAASPGLSVSNGVLLLEGKPFRGVGVNYFSLFSRILQNPADDSSLTNLARLAKAEVPFVRFMACGYWPVEQNLYLTNRNLFYQRMDRVVRAAEDNRIGLIPSLFWHVPTVPDLVGEPMQALGDPESKSSRYIREYTTAFVSRYHKSRAIWGWQFGNELNLAVDLPNASAQRPPVHPSLGTPAERSARDELRARDMLQAYATFAEAVRGIDRERALFTGNALPRIHAWHNTHQASWKEDSREQFEAVLRRDNPPPFETVNVHLYPAKRYPGDARDLRETTRLAARVAKQNRQVLFVGEFGVSREDNVSAIFPEFLTAIEQEAVPLAAIWVFDLPSQPEWSITFENDRLFMLEEIQKLNRRLKQEPVER